MHCRLHSTELIFADRPIADDTAAVLLVTAHPDDECMFFTPAILGLQAAGVAVHVLCLSTGNFDGLGATRALELRASCAALGLPNERVTCVDDPQLQDGPVNAWPPAHVAARVHAHLHALGVSHVLTFDAQGVTRHPNHVAVHAGVRLLLNAPPGSGGAPWRLPRPLVAHELVSTGLLRKHLGLWDALLSLLATLAWLLWRRSVASLLPRRASRHVKEGATKGGAAPSGPRHCCVFTARPRRCHAAMCAHASQYVWYRKLYVLTSRFVWVNTLHRLS